MEITRRDFLNGVLVGSGAAAPSGIPNWRGSNTGGRPRMKAEGQCSNCFESLFPNPALEICSGSSR
ncbi:MAG: twin-arginine translocation signal domain-containing protein [Gammaproteobacteria bacterium]|nr:twin-arginine translocation signal domain-containing protein [Gammaproteobacteria bacterium]